MERPEEIQSKVGSQLLTPEGVSPRVAVVGGTQSSAMVAQMLLAQFGCQPVAAATGEAVLGLLRRDTKVDLVLIDLSVTDMDGIVAVQLIRALGSRGALPVVAIVGDKTEVSSNRARAAGFAGAIVKPYSPRELFEALSSAMARRASRALQA
jgi:CheY-like chemotaxis protein